MRQVLEDLWYYYLIEAPMERNDKEKAIISEWSEKENYFRSKLNEEQLKFLNEYDDAVSQVGRISEKNAFLKGVMFATRFLVEALCGE